MEEISKFVEIAISASQTLPGILALVFSVVVGVGYRAASHGNASLAGVAVVTTMAAAIGFGGVTWWQLMRCSDPGFPITEYNHLGSDENRDGKGVIRVDVPARSVDATVHYYWSVGIARYSYVSPRDLLGKLWLVSDDEEVRISQSGVRSYTTTNDGCADEQGAVGLTANVPYSLELRYSADGGVDLGANLKYRLVPRYCESGLKRYGDACR